MKEQFRYMPKGVCSSCFDFEFEDGKIVSFQSIGGCNGNLKGIGALVQGRDIQEVISSLEGIHCGPRATSCPDQISKALRTYLESK